MASGGGSSLLEIPGAWISKESDPELSTPVPLTPPSSIQPAYISTSLKESPTFPPSCDPLPLPLVPIAVHSTPRVSYPTLGPRESDPRVRKATLVMPVGVKTTAEATLHSVLPLFDGVSNASSVLLTSPIDTTPPPLPREPAETLSGDTTSTHSGVSGLSFGPSRSPLSKCNFDFGFPNIHSNLACKEFISCDSLNYSVADVFPSASINLIPSIPPIATDLHLHNFPTSEELPLEPHSVYFSALEDHLSMSRSSHDGPEPVHETSSPSMSASDLCIPSAEEAHHQILWQENPSPRRRTVRIEVRNNVFQQGAIRQESFTYACKSLPYDAGFRPHAYVDNREYTTHGKHHLEAMEEDLDTMEESMEEDHVTEKSKRPTIFRMLTKGKRMPKFVAFGLLRFQKISKRFPTQSCVPDPRFPAASPSVSNFADRSPHLDNPNYFPTSPPSSPLPSYPTVDKKKHRALFKKSWSDPLSMFVVPRPKVEGKVVPSPKELPTCLPADENLSPLKSPQMRNAEIPQTDVHGKSYGPWRVASPELPPRSPDPSIFRRKKRRPWLTNIRSPKNSPLVA